MQPEVSTTYERGCFKMSQIQTDRHTSGHCNSMTESAKWADSVKIKTCHQHQLFQGPSDLGKYKSSE